MYILQSILKSYGQRTTQGANSDGMYRVRPKFAVFSGYNVEIVRLETIRNSLSRLSVGSMLKENEPEAHCRSNHRVSTWVVPRKCSKRIAPT
jgi:hypothetical protein